MILSLMFTMALVLAHPAMPSGFCVRHGEAVIQNKGQRSCWDQAATQFAMNECAAQDLKQADAELNKTYQQVVARFANDSERIVQIKRAEAAWVAFRDAEIEARFPESSRSERGSVFPMCRSVYLTSLTAARTKALKELLEFKEGEVCNP